MAYYTADFEQQVELREAKQQAYHYARHHDD
jgi:hypothetical protein